MNDQVQDKGKANIRMALILGLVALGFFISGIYMTVSGGAG